MQEQDPFGELPVSFFLQSVLQLHQQRWVIHHIDSFTLWKIINEEDAGLIPKNQGQKFSSRFLHSKFFGAGWAAMPPHHWMLLCLRVIVISPGFFHGHQTRQEIIWITSKKFQKLLRQLPPLMFLIRIQAFWDPLRGEFPHVQIFMHGGPNPLTWVPSCSAIDLAEIWLSSKISSWICSIISGVVGVLGCPGRDTWYVEKLTHIKWATQFFMVAYDGACFPYISVRMVWISFGTLPQGKTWWQLASQCCWNRACHQTCFLSAFVTWRLAIQHMNRPLIPMTLSIPSYDIEK